MGHLELELFFDPTLLIITRMATKTIKTVDALRITTK
jgi:hypothetical protein